LTNRTDALGRVTLYQWCSCGSIKSLVDPMGHTTLWHKDLQDRLVSKEYGDGSMQRYFYERTTSRLREFVDEREQSSQFTYNRDDSLQSITYANSIIPTPPVTYAYDPDYERVISMTDGSGTTIYAYAPITSSPLLGAGLLATVAGPWANSTISYGYDELGRIISTSINGISETKVFDEGGRVVGRTNALGSFSYMYDGPSSRVLSVSFPNSQTATRHYGDNVHDLLLDRITYQHGGNPISDFSYTYDSPADRILTWSQQAGTAPTDLFTLTYDLENQLLSATVTNSGSFTHNYGYSYDPDGNRLVEQIDSSSYKATYNALNQINTSTAPGASRTNEFDAQRRLVAVTSSNARTELVYDGRSRLVGIRQLTNGVQISWRRFLWEDNRLAEERDEANNVMKRFFADGVQFATGASAGRYFYTRDHLGSIRELTDSNGAVRARYTYDPFGRRKKISGDLDADFGFAQMVYASEADLDLAMFRAYDPSTSRWLSRDPLRTAEWQEGANLYTYVANDPISLIDPLGLEPVPVWNGKFWYVPCCLKELRAKQEAPNLCARDIRDAGIRCRDADPEIREVACAEFDRRVNARCEGYDYFFDKAADEYRRCLAKNKCIVPCRGVAYLPTVAPKPYAASHQ
jgi:RHS repeat-associated protein